jgi:metal-responsive CopG/Arc/MetJ family transcriptional regulator
MKKRTQARRSTKEPDPETVRASISFPTDLYKALEEKARQKKVSLAWIVRDATEKYLDQLTSLDEGGPSR